MKTYILVMETLNKRDYISVIISNVSLQPTALYLRSASHVNTHLYPDILNLIYRTPLPPPTTRYKQPSTKPGSLSALDLYKPASTVKDYQHYCCGLQC